jgi:hypothetical protein
MQVAKTWWRLSLGYDCFAENKIISFMEIVKISLVCLPVNNLFKGNMN